MTDSTLSSNTEKNFLKIRSSLSNEHLVFADSLRDWKDPLLHGQEPIHTPLCPRCATCKCESLKNLPNPHFNFTSHHHIHDPSCPNFRQPSDRTQQQKRRATSYDPSLSILNTSSSSSSIIQSLSAEHSPLNHSIKRKKPTIRISSASKHSPSSAISLLNQQTQIPQLISTLRLSPPETAITTTNPEIFEIDSLNDDTDQIDSSTSDHENVVNKKQKAAQTLDSMDEQISIKKKKRRQHRTSSSSSSPSDREQQPYRPKEGRPTKSKSTSNDLSSSSNSSSSSSLSGVPIRKKSHLYPTTKGISSLSDDSLSGKSEKKKSSRQSRPRSAYLSRNSTPSIYLIEIPDRNSFGLTKTQTYLWKNSNSNEEDEIYPNYSIERVQPDANLSKRSMSTSTRNVILERGQVDYWHNCDLSPDAIITSSCQNSTGSASHVLSLTADINSQQTPTNSTGHIISITTTKRQQPSLLNQTSNVQWNIERDGKLFRYSKIKWHSDEQLHKPQIITTQAVVTSEPELNPIEIDATAHEPAWKPISYESTDEDVDELNSHISEMIDQVLPHLSIEKTDSNLDSTFPPRTFSTEYSQITTDSGVDINSEQKIYQPNTNLIIDEQSSEDTATDQNDLFALSDDSLIEIQTKSWRNNRLLNSYDLSHSFNQTDQETFFTAKSEVPIEKDLYSGYELETVTDEEDDPPNKNGTNELILTSEKTSPPPPSRPAPPTVTPLPPQFEFKLPTFGEWIDRVFTDFLTETNRNPSQSMASSRSSSIVSIHNSQTTINTSSSSQVITVVENENFHPNQPEHQPEKDDDEHSLNDMSSSSLNSDEKVDFDTYIINSNYEKINPSFITNEQNEFLFINERSKSLLSSITSSIENDDQEVMNNEAVLISTDLQPNTTLFNDDLAEINPNLSSTFYSRDSALGLSDENLHDLVKSKEKMNHMVKDTTIQQMNTIDDLLQNEHDQSIERTVSSSSSEQLIPKEKQTGMYYKAFGSSAALHLAEQYNSEWLQEPSHPNQSSNENSNLRIVHQYENLGDNEDEFYFSPQCLHPSYSCPNLYSNPAESRFYPRSYSLTTLDTYAHLNLTHETLEQIWLSLLDVAFSDRDDYELGEYKLRHIIGLSNSYSNLNQNLIEKSRSHNDIFSLKSKPNQQKTITKIKSKSFDITSLIKQSAINHDSANIGLLQGADISELFADRLISRSVQSDLESIHSFEAEQILNESLPTEPAPPSPSPTPLSPPPVVVKEPLDFVFHFSPSMITDEFDLESDDKPLDIPIAFETDDDLPPPPLMIPIKDTYTELSLFRPHSLSTIPSSRASQYASSIDSDDFYEREHHLIKADSEENCQYHLSDDDRGVIGSEFSSPQSRPLSSIQSRPLSPEPNLSSMKFADIDHEAWERAINEEYTQNLSSIIPMENIEEKNTYVIDEIQPVMITNETPRKSFIEETHLEQNPLVIQQDYLDPQELSQRLEQLDHSTEQQEKILVQQPIITKSLQRLDKVSDLEIVKQGKGFKIGYVDRQGTDQRIILTKRIEAGPDIMERDPHSRLPSKGRRILNQMSSSVLYTNGYNTLQEDKKFEHTANEIEVLSIGTNPKHFDESDMVSIDIDGPSTMLSSICESIVITQGSVYSKPPPKQTEEDPLLLQTTHSIKKDKIEIIDSWHDRTIIHGNGTPWRSPLKPPKTAKSTRDIALSPIFLAIENQSQTEDTSLPTVVDRSCQYSPPNQQDQSLQCYIESSTGYEHPGYYKLPTENPSLRTLMALERSADSGILVDENHRMKSNLALQVDIKSSSSDSEDLSEVNTRPLNIYENPNMTHELEEEILQLSRERTHILDLLSLNWNRSNIWVELTEAKLNYIIGETDALLRSLSFDPSPVDNETIKLKMHRYEEDMAELTRQHLAVYRERLEDSKKQLDLKINELESRKSLMDNQTRNSHLSTFEQTSCQLTNKRTNSFLSTSAENLTRIPFDDSISTHPHFLDISFLTTKTSDPTLHRPMTARYTSKDLSKMEGLTQSQQAIIDETDKLIQDSQQLHTESASQFERARESLLSSETSIRLARANLAASRHSERKTYLSKDVTLAELFKYEQLLAKETSKSYRHIYSTTEF